MRKAKPYTTVLSLQPLNYFIVKTLQRQKKKQKDVLVEGVEIPVLDHGNYGEAGGISRLDSITNISGTI